MVVVPVVGWTTTKSEEPSFTTKLGRLLPEVCRANEFEFSVSRTRAFTVADEVATIEAELADTTARPASALVELIVTALGP